MKHIVIFLLCLCIASQAIASDKQFESSSFSFAYPETISVKEETGFGLTKVVASATNSLIVIIMAYPDDSTSPDDASKEFFRDMAKGLREKGAKLAIDKVIGIKRVIGGEAYKSVLMPYSFGGVDFIYDVVGFQKNGKTIVWVTQYATEDIKLSETYMQTMTSSFR